MRWCALLFLLAGDAGACTCIASYSACQAAKVSNLVFAGRVESIEPKYLNRWTTLDAGQAARLAEVMRLESESTPAAIERLKAAYLELAPELEESTKRSIRDARTRREVMAAIGAALERGIRVHFKVITVFAEHDDDDDDDKSGAKRMEFADVWTDAGDCGFDFIPGETYLVYAVSDERSDKLETTRCTRTRRLSDAGEDLSYLYFVEHAGAAAARVEGFITSNRKELVPDRFHYSGRIGSPVAGSVVELRSGDKVRYATTDAGGRFVLDGVTEGAYRVSAFQEGYPAMVRPIAAAVDLQVKKNECASVILFSGPN